MATIDRRGVSVNATDTPIAGDPNPGLAIKAPALVATTANITLSGIQTIDGVSVGNNSERVLVWQQTDQTTNGLYNASSGNWTRTIDLATNDQIANGFLVMVTEGSTHADTLFEQTTSDPVTIGTSNIVFVISSVTATRNINTTAPLAGGGNLSVDRTLSLVINGSLQVTGGALAVAQSNAVAHQWVSSISAAGVPQYSQPGVADIANGAALTGANDTNVTITVSAGGATALLSAASLTMGWIGTLAAGRLNSNVVQGITNDTNIQGSISGQVLTFSWASTLAVARGGTGGGVASGTLLDNITGFASTGFLKRTGAGAYSFIADPLPAANGGSGIANPTAHSILQAEGAGNYGLITAATAGNIIVDQGAGADWLSKAVSGDATLAASGALTIAAGAVTNAKMANVAAWTLKGNATASLAAPQDFTIASLTSKASPAGTDLVLLWDGATSAMKQTTVSALSSAGSVASINAATGAITLAGSGGTAINTSGSTITVESPGGLLNKFRNGTMDVWQRGLTPTLSTSTAGSSYVPDGWIVTWTASVAAVPAATQAAGRSLTVNSLKVTGATNITDVAVKQRIESYVSAPMTSQTVTVQAQIFNNTGGSITPTLTIKHATAQDNWGATTTDVSAVSLQACGNAAWTQVCYTFAAAAGTSNGLEVTIDFGNNFSANTKSVQITELDIRVTPGVTTGLNSLAPPPELRPIWQEMSFCQRYFISTYGNNLTGNAGGTATGNGIVGGVSNSAGATAEAIAILYPVQLRAAASTISIWDEGGNASKMSIRQSAAWTNNQTAGAVGTGGSGETGFVLDGTASAISSFIHYQATAEL